MNISEEITRLADLKEKGILSPEEFEQAKKRILSGQQSSRESRPPEHTKRYQVEDKSHESFGKAANRYVTFQIIMTVIGIIVFLLFFAPMMCSSGSPNFPSGFPR